MRLTFLSPLLAFALVTPAFAVDTSLQLVITLKGDAERNVVTYECPDKAPFDVDYINAAPTFMALVPIEGEQQIFVNVLSGSGARYVSGQYEWFTNGPDATLTDLMAEDGTEPTHCMEVTMTP